jgi:hypothetical protein
METPLEHVTIDADLVDRIKRYLVELVASYSGGIVATELGSQLKRQFPQVDFRRHFNGLRRFIGAYCADEIVVVGEQGGNPIYGHSSRQVAKPLLPSDSPNPEYELWLAFTNPNLNKILVVDRTTGDLKTQEASTGPPDGHAVIASLTTEDYRRIGQDFLASQAKPHPPAAVEALRAPNFWDAWVTALAPYRQTPLYAGWLRSRVEQIATLLKERLTAAELSPEVIPRVLSKLDAARTSKKPTASPGKGTFQSATATFGGLALRDARTPPIVRTVNSKDLARAAISYMSEDELRHLWVPLGAVVSALRRDLK